MKKYVCLAAILAALLLTSCGRKPPETVHRIPYTAIGIPTEAAYPEGDIARSPWDMILHDGCLFVGSGDFDKNTGPTPIYAYDTETGTWTESERFAEEEYNRFVMIDGKLVTPGIDPRQPWSLGNYYSLEEGTWKKHRVLPDGVHAFDIAMYHGALFAGLGVSSGKLPVVRSTDGGESFAPVTFLRDGAPVDTAESKLIRTYDLLMFQDALYATLSLGDKNPDYTLYKYDDAIEAFVFVKDLNTVLDRIKFNHQRITSTAVYNGEMLLVTGKLYATGDMNDFREIRLDGVDLVCDIYEDGEKAYLLTATKADDEEGVFKTSVYEISKSKKKTVFYEIFNFYYDVPPVSLAKDGKDFYIGLANTTATNDLNGTIVHVEYKE